MSIRPHYFVTHIAPFAVAFTTALALSACSSAPATQAESSEEITQAPEPYQVEKPSAAELAKSPCGNPDWAQLPEGAEDKLPASQPTDASDTSDTSDTPDSKSPKTAPESSPSTSLYPQIQPCV